jgi:HK97 family phage major capsid protein
MFKKKSAYLAGSQVGSSAEMVAVMKKAYEAEGHVDNRWVNEAKSFEAIQTKNLLFGENKADEIMHTTNTNAGAELVPDSVLATDFIDLIPKSQSLIGVFPGFHGRNMDKIMKVPVIGETPLHDLGSERTTGAFAVAQGKGKLPTGEVTITQKKFEFSIDVSDELARFGIVNVLAEVQKKLAKSAARTIEAFILNGDVVTAATGNVNSDDGAPASTRYYLGADGVIKQAFTDSLTANLGTADITDFTTLMNLLEDYASDPEDMVWVFNRQTYNKYLTVDQFLDASKNGKSSTVNSGAITNIFGSDVFIARDLKKAEADGKRSVTESNNTLGRLALIHKMAVQYGFNGVYEIEMVRVPAQGWQVFGHYYMGLAIVAKDVLGSGNEETPLVALGINITV